MGKIEMAHIERIRWLHLQEEWSIRRIAQHLGISRRTVRKYLDNPQPPRYHRSKPYACPVLEPYKAQIEQWLQEDESRPRKQRHTARRIFQRLRAECGDTGSEPTVRRYVARLGRKAPEVYVPLEFSPGEAAEVDFGQAVAVIAGVEADAFYLCTRLRYSHMPFVIAFPHQRQEALLEGIRRALEFLGGVPMRLIFDNLKQAVQKVLEGKNRREQDAFRGLRTHYLFESTFCNPAAGWEKGSVESLVGFVRRTFLTPVPEAASWEALNAALQAACLQYAQRTLRGERQSVLERWQLERAALRPLPPVPYPCCRVVPVTASRTACVQFETCLYSVPARYAHQKLTLRAYVEWVEVYAGLECIARHRRSYQRGADILDLDHYLELLLRKPGALDNARPLRAAGLPAVYGQYRAELQRHHQRGDREFVRVLMLHREFPADQVEAALGEALHLQAYGAEAVREILLGHTPAAPALDLSSRPRLSQVAVDKPTLAQYSRLLGEGGVVQ